MDNNKISSRVYRDAQNFEKIADLSWELASRLSEFFVGYEDDVRRLHSLFQEFSRSFREIVPYEDVIDEG